MKGATLVLCFRKPKLVWGGAKRWGKGHGKKHVEMCRVEAKSILRFGYSFLSVCIYQNSLVVYFEYVNIYYTRELLNEKAKFCCDVCFQGTELV